LSSASGALVIRRIAAKGWFAAVRRKTAPHSSDLRRASIALRFNTPTPANHATRANISDFSADFSTAC
jgi:hypothetical protein